MFSLLTVVMAFAAGAAIGASFVWLVTGNQRSAAATLGFNVPVILLLMLRIASEWR